MARASGERVAPDTGQKLGMDAHPLIRAVERPQRSVWVSPSMIFGLDQGVLPAFRGGVSADRRPNHRMLGALPAPWPRCRSVTSRPPFAAYGAQIIPDQPTHTRRLQALIVRADRRLGVRLPRTLSTVCKSGPGPSSHRARSYIYASAALSANIRSCRRRCVPWPDRSGIYRRLSSYAKLSLQAALSKTIEPPQGS